MSPPPPCGSVGRQRQQAGSRQRNAAAVQLQATAAAGSRRQRQRNGGSSAAQQCSGSGRQRLTRYKQAKTRAGTQTDRQLNRKRNAALNALHGVGGSVHASGAPTHEKTDTLYNNHTKTQNCRQNTQKRKNVRVKKLAMQRGRVYYKLASNEGGSLRTGRSPHNRQRGQLSLKNLTTKK